MEEGRFLKGTEVEFTVGRRVRRALRDVFSQFAPEEYSFQFEKTRVIVRLLGKDYVSRSEARRLVAGLDRFKEVELDFDGVKSLGQGFADEVFRVFPAAHPGIRLSAVRVSPLLQAVIRHGIDNKSIRYIDNRLTIALPAPPWTAGSRAGAGGPRRERPRPWSGSALVFPPRSAIFLPRKGAEHGRRIHLQPGPGHQAVQQRHRPGRHHPGVLLRRQDRRDRRQRLGQVHPAAHHRRAWTRTSWARHRSPEASARSATCRRSRSWTREDRAGIVEEGVAEARAILDRYDEVCETAGRDPARRASPRSSTTSWAGCRT